MPSRKQGHSSGVKQRTKPEAARDAVRSDTPETQTTKRPASRPFYFWRETEEGAGYLSQWYPSPFTDLEGTVYPTAEHYMMYQKALLFNDTDTAAAILAPGTSPRNVMGMGRHVAGFDEAVWCAERERIVREGTLFKFTRAVAGEEEAGLSELLLATGDRELVEASPADRIWGIGFRESVAGARRAQWGLNLLGKALMHVRETIRREENEEREDEEREDEEREDEDGRNGGANT